jgi:prepilin-type N-terminal cleavage/methylation domain-containing protein
MQLRHSVRGFTLTELAVVFAIIALLVGGAMMTLSAQVEQRNNDEAVRRLNAAAEAVLAFAIVNRRLPCPATAGTTGDEAPAGGTCTTWYGGFLPARTIGFQPVDTSGYGVDAWGNRLRYAVANLITGCTGSSTTPHFTSDANLKANGVSCRPNDLDICSSSTGSTATSCNTAPRVASTQTVAFVVYSTGKNGANTTSYGADETENTDGDRVFVSRTPSGADATGGTYDDLMVFVPAGVLYSKLISAAILP